MTTGHVETAGPGKQSKTMMTLSRVLQTLRRPAVLATLLGVLLAAWMISGDFSSQVSASSGPAAPERTASSELEPHLRVETLRLERELVTDELLLPAQLEPVRWVRLRAEIAGRVAALPASKGERLASGDPIALLSIEDRRERRTEAAARLEQARHDAEAGRRLVTEGVQSEALQMRREFELASAVAQLAAIDQEIARTRIAAPFAGVLEERAVELGDVVQPGDDVATLVDLSELLIVAQVPQDAIAAIERGGLAHVRLRSGEALVGTVRFVAAVGDPDTRSFRVEVAVPNPDGRLSAGSSADLVLPVREVPGHRLPASILAVGADASVGVKVIDAAGMVSLERVSVLRAEQDAVWVEGLRDDVEVIVTGHGFVEPHMTLRRIDVQGRRATHVLISAREQT